jgi:hypothetical protein
MWLFLMKAAHSQRIFKRLLKMRNGQNLSKMLLSQDQGHILYLAQPTPTKLQFWGGS